MMGSKYRPRAKFVRETPDVRRQALIEATARCLSEKGVGGTSVRAICAQAGVSSGLLTHYFEGVNALILATYLDVGATVSAALDQAVEDAGDDPRDRLRACLQANFRAPILDPDLLATWIAFWSLVKSDPAIAAVHGPAAHVLEGTFRMAVLPDCRAGEHPFRLRDRDGIATRISLIESLAITSSRCLEL